MSNLNSDFNSNTQDQSGASAFRAFNPNSEIRLRQWYYPLWFSLFALVAGGYLTLNPTSLFIILSYLFGTVFALMSLKNLKNQKGQSNQVLNFLTGIFYLGVAGLFFLYPSISLIALPFIFGIIILLFSLGLFFLGRKIPKEPLFMPRPFKWFVVGAIFLVIAYFAFTEPKGFSALIGFWVGVLLLVSAVAGVIIAYFLRRLRLRLPLTGKF